MSSRTWTPDALSREAKRYAGCCWRLVEAQHRVSTLKLADSLEEQQVLEDLIEATKPPIPEDCRHLDYLLATPFRYGAVYPKGSRFRRAGRTLGVYYGAEEVETAVAEMAFYRLLFFSESPDTPWPADAAEYTAFSATIQTDRAVDLTVPPFVAHRSIWTHAINYEQCQALADAARLGNVAVIRYESIRDPKHRANLAVLVCAAFADNAPVDRQTWRIRLAPSGVVAICEFPYKGLEFPPALFAADPRIASMHWER
jgi:hypothetical protein